MSRRELCRNAFDAAISAVDPAVATRDWLLSNPLSASSVRVVAIGKASPGMARGAHEVLGDRIVGGIVVSDQIEATPSCYLDLAGDHPLPGERSLVAGFAVAQQAGCGDHELLLVLISGGGSSLAEIPRDEVSVADLAGITDALLHGGADIESINVVRRHLSKLKNGNLLKMSATPVVTLLINDVTDGPPSTIASGPTLRDVSTSAEADAVLTKYADPSKEPFSRVSKCLLAAGSDPVTPNCVSHRWSVVADRHGAASAALETLRDAGYDAKVAERTLEGPAAQTALDILGRMPIGEARVFTGETTVDVTGSGRGGRNHHAALSAAIWLQGKPTYTFAAFGTDGIDGSARCAGATVDGGTTDRMRRAGFDPQLALLNCDSWTALSSAGATETTGRTGTNVGDLWLVLA